LKDAVVFTERKWKEKRSSPAEVEAKRTRVASEMLGGKKIGRKKKELQNGGWPILRRAYREKREWSLRFKTYLSTTDKDGRVGNIPNGVDFQGGL